MLKHRIRAEINQKIAEIPESWFQTFIGFIAVVIVVLFLAFYVEPFLASLTEGK